MKGRSCLLRCGHTRINDLIITANKWATIRNNFNFQPKQDKEKTLFGTLFISVVLIHDMRKQFPLCCCYCVALVAKD